MLHMGTKYKRVVIQVTNEQHETLTKMVELTGVKTLANYFRKAVGLPLQDKGERKDLPKK